MSLRQGVWVRRLTIDDDYMMLLHTPSTPMQIGALQYFDVPAERRGHFAADVVEHLRDRLPSSGLACVRRRAPLGFDTDVWVDTSWADVEAKVEVLSVGAPPDREQVEALVATWVCDHLDPDRPPFRIVVMDELADGGAAIYLSVHHALADGIGFQAIVGRLTDPGPGPGTFPVTEPAGGGRDGRAPPAPLWLARSAGRFAVEAVRRRRDRSRRAAARAAMAAFRADPAHRRARTPRFEMSGPTSVARSYTTLSLPLDDLRRWARAAGATVNDLFLTIGAGAVREYLSDQGLLPEQPLVALAARSYRRPEDGDLGNRIVSLQPQLATHVADPLQRLAAIQASMAVEVARSRLFEDLIDPDDRPFGPRRRLRRYAERQAGGDAVLPGNLTMSNVPGPAEARYLAGYLQTANYPAPILGSGRFMNLTLRRYRDALDLGIMTDAAKIPHAAALRPYLEAAMSDLGAAVNL